MIDYFAKTYEKCIFMHKHDYNVGMVERFQPVIVSENVERYNYSVLTWTGKDSEDNK